LKVVGTISIDYKGYP